MATETEVLTLIDLPLKTTLQEGDYFPVGNSTQDYRVPSSAIAEKLGVPGMQSDIKNKADKDLGNVESVAQNSPVATKQDITTASNAAQNALTKAEQAQSSVSNLQTQINSLNMEVSKMLGRPNYRAGVSVGLSTTTYGSGKTATYTVPSDGFLWVERVTGEQTVYINNVVLVVSKASVNSYDLIRTLIPVSAGDILRVENNSNTTGIFSGFFAPNL